MAYTRITFLLVCLGVRAELEPGEATEELVMPALLRSAAAGVVLVALAAVAVSNPPFAEVAAGTPARPRLASSVPAPPV